MKRQRQSGFTLIELLVVIAIVAILAVVLILLLNPAELLRQSRDSNRISDLGITKTALNLYLTGVTSFNLASSSFGYSACYLSTTPGNGTSSPYCGIFINTGSSTDASTTSANGTYRKIDSTGWIPVNFSQIGFGTPFGALPVDPTNNASYYYAYAASSTGSYELGTIIESKKYGVGGSNSVVTTSSIYETGSTLLL